MKVRIGYGLGAHARLTAERLQRDGRHARGAAVRLAVALGAGERRRARSDHRALGRGRPHEEAQARDERAGAAGSQPGAARQGAGEPRRAVRRAAAARVRARGREPGRAAGVRRRARGPVGVVRRGAAAGPAPLDRGRGRPRRRPLPLRGPRACCRSRCSSRPTCGSAARRRASCAASGGSATAGSRRSRRPPICAAEPAGDRGGRRRSRVARSTPSTTARWSSTRTARCPSRSRR